MNNNYEHAVLTAIFCAAVMIAGASMYWFACPAVFFIGREHAQAEYRWIQRYGNGLRANMPWWGGFDARIWDRHSFVWNLSLPVLVSMVAMLIVTK